MKMFALRETRRQRAFYALIIQSNEGCEFCGSYSAHLSASPGDTPWLTMDRAIAERILSEEIPWYNSSIDHPTFYECNRNNVEIVEFKMIET